MRSLAGSSLSASSISVRFTLRPPRVRPGTASAGAAFTAWGGYIKGRNLTLEPPRRIVQSWRTTKFTRTDADSQIEVLLEPVATGTRLILHHTNVPDGHTGYQNGGWQEHYFEPMKRYFGAKD